MGGAPALSGATTTEGRGYTPDAMHSPDASPAPRNERTRTAPAREPTRRAEGVPPAGVSPTLVLRTVLYYDIFRHPLTRAELARLCGGDVDRLVDALVAAGSLEVEGTYVCRPGQRAHVEGRRARSLEAERLWADAQISAGLLARFPHVRGVFVTGGLSKQSAPRGGDVDFLLLIEPGWVWTTKSALQVLRRGLPERTRNLFCTNYLLDTDHLLVDDRNVFTAMELATAVPLYGPDACVAFLSANTWAEAHVPGLRWNVERARHARPLRQVRWAEAATAPLRGLLEERAMKLWTGFWDHKYDWLPERARAQRFKRRPEIATNHLHDFQDYVLRELASRCHAAGIEPA
jgi:hypothetical protein